MPEKKPYTKPTREIVPVLNKVEKKNIPALSLTLPIYAKNADTLSQYVHTQDQSGLTDAWNELPMKYKLLAGILQQHADNPTLSNIQFENDLGNYQPDSPRETTIVNLVIALSHHPNNEILAAEIVESIPELVTPKSKSEIQSIIETNADECIAEIKRIIEDKRNELPPQIRNSVQFDVEICFLLGLSDDLVTDGGGLPRIIESVRQHEFAQNCPTLTDLKDCVSDLLDETLRGYPASLLAQQRKLLMGGWHAWKENPQEALSRLRTKFNTDIEDSSLSSYEFGHKRELALILTDLDRHGKVADLFEFVGMSSLDTVKPGKYETICTDPMQSGSPSLYRVEVTKLTPGSELLHQVDPVTKVKFAEGELVVHIQVYGHPTRVNTYKLSTLEDDGKLHLAPVST